MQEGRKIAFDYRQRYQMDFDFFVCSDDDLSRKINKFTCEFYVVKKYAPSGKIDIKFNKLIRMDKGTICADSL
jgi:hypothetical protein